MMCSINGVVTCLKHIEQHPLDSDTDATLLMVMRTRMGMPTLMMMMLVMRTVFATIIKVWEVIRIVVTMILLLKLNLP